MLFIFTDGVILTVILWGKKVFAKNSEAFYIYVFLLVLWIFRVAVAMIYPCPPESNVWMSYGQLSGSVLVCLAGHVGGGSGVRSGAVRGF